MFRKSGGLIPLAGAWVKSATQNSISRRIHVGAQRWSQPMTIGAKLPSGTACHIYRTTLRTHPNQVSKMQMASEMGGLVRQFSSNAGRRGPQQSLQEKNKQMFTYLVAVALGTVGLSYAAVPLYRMFCQATGYGGTVQDGHRTLEELTKIQDNLPPIEERRELTIKFNADVSDTMPWKFHPAQREVKLVPGETALAFYNATNKTDDPVTGISTYNVTPMKAGVYFNKIQCFCFEEQRLNPREEVMMPVFFFIDPEFLEDPAMNDVATITLSYTFFKAGEDSQIQ
eukprot:GFYU01010496.1.p1 GENE.GFYU01010496.1~~GFYU01010496.1.p1  ORF type:complete len:284 (-),score=34.45 GFYU01010496.1:102-953(-)